MPCRELSRRRCLVKRLLGVDLERCIALRSEAGVGGGELDVLELWVVLSGLLCLGRGSCM